MSVDKVPVEQDHACSLLAVQGPLTPQPLSSVVTDKLATLLPVRGRAGRDKSQCHS